MKDYVFQGYRGNGRLEQYLAALEVLNQDLERSTRRFKETNDRLEKTLKA